MSIVGPQLNRPMFSGRLNLPVDNGIGEKPSQKASTQVSVSGAPVAGQESLSRISPAYFGPQHFGLIQPAMGKNGIAPVRFGITAFSPGDILVGAHPPNEELDKIDYWRKKITDMATRPREGFPQGWLQPLPTVFKVVDLIELMQITARIGFPIRYPHWRWGMNFNESYQPQKHGMGRLYELVVNTDPSYAYLLNTNPLHAQKWVMAHVFGHTDFFANNWRFSKSNRKIMHEMVKTREVVQSHLEDPILRKKIGEDGYHPVYKFLDNFHAIENLVDWNALEPPEITPLGEARTRPKMKLPSAEGLGPNMKELKGSSWMKDFILSPEERKAHEADLLQFEEEKVKKVPPRPTRDVIGFIIEHSRGLEDWQREILIQLRKEAYYFAPQVHTKIMNEGWATFWHNKLTQDEHDEVLEPQEVGPACKAMAGVERPNPQSLNPYLLGLKMFIDLYKRAGLDLPISDFQSELHPERKLSLQDYEKKMKEKPDDTKGIQKIKEICYSEDDISFIEKYLNENIIKDMDLYIRDFYKGWNRDTGQEELIHVIISKDPKRVKEKVVGDLINGRQPIIEVEDGNYNGGGLLLNHQHLGKDINREDALKTMKSVQTMWGAPVYLNSLYTVDYDLQALTRVIEDLHRHREQQEWMKKNPNAGWGQSQDVYEEEIKRLEEEYFRIKENVRRVPIQYVCKDGKDVEIYELDSKGNRVGPWDPKKFVPPPPPRYRY